MSNAINTKSGSTKAADSSIEDYRKGNCHYERRHDTGKIPARSTIFDCPSLMEKERSRDAEFSAESLRFRTARPLTRHGSRQRLEPDVAGWEVMAPS